MNKQRDVGELTMACDINLEESIMKMCQAHIPEWFDQAMSKKVDNGVTVYLQFYKLLVKHRYIDINAPSSSFQNAVKHLVAHPEELQLMVL